MVSIFSVISRKVPVSIIVLLSICFAPSARGEEPIATYPLLPSHYSSTKVFDREGRFVGRIMPEGRFWTPIERIPAFLQRAVVAVEDARFYEHGGIDIRGIARALVKDVVKGKLVEGGSTITQQLIKNRYLSGEKTIDRKLKEGKMAVEFERKYTKQQILEMYFNEIYYGNGAWGIAQAARIYFDKNPEQLSEAECALLAGVPKNPGRYNPWGKSDKVVMRRDVVLKRMVELKMITTRQRDALRAERVTFAQASQAPYYLAHVKSKLIERFGREIVEQGGLDVMAALDLNLQKLAEQTLRDGVKRHNPELQGALVSMDLATGDLLAEAGGVDFAKSSYDRALYAQRQPGSAIKPLIYAAALEQGVTAARRWDDTPVAYDRGNNETWTPLNYGREKYGELSLREALAFSNNVITVKLLDTIGVSYFVTFAEKFGLSLQAGNGLSLGLGTSEVTLYDLVRAYTPLANGGVRIEPRTIIRIRDHIRQTVTDVPPAITPVISPAAAFVATSMLEDVLAYGTAKSLGGFSRERPMAGKTGTTDDYRDAWFIGYTPQVITGIWVGYDKPRPGGKGFTGGAVCAPLWERFMRPALASRPVIAFTKPDNVIEAVVDPDTGMLANTDCPEKEEEFFIAGTEPTGNCPTHGGAPLNMAPSPQLQPDGKDALPLGRPLLPMTTFENMSVPRQ